MSDTKKLAVSICLLVLLVGGVGATDGNAMSVEAGLLFVGNAEPDSAPSPVVQALGLSVTVYEGTFALVTTGVHVFGTLNQLVEAVPLPVELEVPGQTWIWVLNGVIELLGGFKVTLGDLAQVGLLVGPSVLLRYPLLASEGAEDDKNAAIRYYYDVGRFFYPAAGLFLRWEMSEGLAVSVSMRGYLPAYHFWHESGLPLWHEMLVAARIGFHVRLW